MVGGPCEDLTHGSFSALVLWQRGKGNQGAYLQERSMPTPTDPTARLTPFRVELSWERAFLSVKTAGPANRARRSGQSAVSPWAEGGSPSSLGRSFARNERPPVLRARSSPFAAREPGVPAAGGGGVGGRRWREARGCRGDSEMAETVADTRRLITKPQNLNDAYGPPSNFLEIDVSNPQTVGVGRGRFTTYEIRVKTNLPIFKLKESTVRRRYSDFEWLRSELERESKVVVPPLPGKAFLRQLPFRGDDGIFDDNFIEERKQGLEQFINKVAGHPLAQNERCLHMFLQDEIIDKSYTPSKIRHA